MNDILYEGKSKIIHKGIDQDTLLIRYKDTATAFNGEKKEDLPGKGNLNAEISNILYSYLMQNNIKTHMLKIIDPISILVKKAEIIPVEVIIRNLAAGGFSKKYGISEGTPLQNTVLEFCYKSDEHGDPMMNVSQITALALATKQELEHMTNQTLKINELLSQLFQKIGITLVDFKLEFGRYQGEIILCDEISPDSCRLWDKSTSEKLDKDRFRRDLGDVLGGYEDVLRRLRNVGEI